MKRQFPALRGLAILLVVINHTIQLGYLNTIKESGFTETGGWVSVVLLVLQQLGLVAVPLFLFISGGFFAYAAQGTPPRLKYKVVWTNVFHVLWPYLIWCVIYYVYIYFTHGDLKTPSEYAKSLIVGFPFNFVPLLIFFYLVSPILVLLANRIGWGLVIGAIALYQVFLFGVVNPGALGFSLPGWAGLLAPPVIKNTFADWGIYFPLGLFFILNAKRVDTWAIKLRWVLASLTLIFYILNLLHWMHRISLPFAGHLFALSFVCFSVTITRNSIPFVRQLEYLGKRAYGLYLTDLIAIDSVLLVINSYLPGLTAYQIILQPILFTLALAIPLGLMSLVERLPKRSIYRYMFG